MFLPNDVNELYHQFSEEVHAAKLLNKKTKELIAVACSVMADCIPCTEWHYKQALEAGATRDEISEALAISVSINGGSKLAKFGPVISSLENSK